MFLIMSAAYVDVELQSEFGLIPPSLLPLGNRRLFQHQNNIIPFDAKKYISLPESYELTSMDALWLNNNDFTVIFIPDGLSLGASLVASISLIDDLIEKPLHILFGDTLLTELPLGNDIIAISSVDDSYNWSTLNNSFTLSKKQLSNDVVCGYFKFSEPRQLVKCITQQHWDFIEGLNRYNNEISLTPVLTDKWLDFGHVNTYYRSKAKFTTQRAFNELIITLDWIEKSSYKTEKIKAEANWFENLPANMRNYIPQYMGSYLNNSKFSYRLEYLHQTALNELYVFSKLPTSSWNNIFKSCIGFIKDCESNLAPEATNYSKLEHLFGSKTSLRLSEYCNVRNITLDTAWLYDGYSVTLSEILALSEQWLPENDVMKPSILHGDFCFSNILYDFRTNRIKTIDPRGLTHVNEQSIYGDIRYDIAKLSHSILGLYDWIIAGYYDVNIEEQNIFFNIIENKQLEEAQQTFINLISAEFKLSPMNLYAMQIQLFLSMLPLHSDDEMRQDALFANAFRLYNILKGYTQ
ncbi:TPA: capsular biosynthesis protein [Photobacterium damselae]